MSETSATTPEQRTADALLQTPLTVKVGERDYHVSPPTLGTLIAVSKEISHLPSLHLDPERVVEASLASARYCEPLARVVALMMLGSQQAQEPSGNAPKRSRIITTLRRWLPFLPLPKTPTRLEALTLELLNEATPRQLHNITAQLIGQMQVGDFFGFTTFLCEINTLRPTREVATTPTAATAPGPSSPA